MRLSGSAGCYAAPVARPDGLGPRDRLVADIEPSYRSANSAETVSNSLIIDKSELANSAKNGLGATNGHHGLRPARC